MAAMMHHAQYSLSDEGKVYHAVNFGEDYPGYRPADVDMPDDKPGDNDQRFGYYTNVKVWTSCQVKEERTLRVASDKVNAWLDLGLPNNPSLTAAFPPSQEEANQGSTANKSNGKGARKRQSSVPPDSDTAKAKQAKLQSDEKDKKAGAGKGRIPSIPKQELSAIAAKLVDKVQTVIPHLIPKHNRTLLNLASEWYKAIYHTKFHLTKAAYLQHLYESAVMSQRIKEANPKHLEVFTKALDVLKSSVDDPTTAGILQPPLLTQQLLNDKLNLRVNPRQTHMPQQ